MTYCPQSTGALSERTSDAGIHSEDIDGEEALLVDVVEDLDELAEGAKGENYSELTRSGRRRRRRLYRDDKAAFVLEVDDETDEVRI
jgi:hypothetical protein